MTKFNKNLLTAAVVGALVLPGVAMAASANYANGTQTHFATDVIVDDTATVFTPGPFAISLIATDTFAHTNALTKINATDVVTVRIRIGNGAKFDSAYAATAAGVVSISYGAQIGAGSTTVLNSANFATGDTEFSWKLTAQNNAVLGAVGDTFATVGNLRLKNLSQALGTAGGSVPVSIDIFNDADELVASANAVLARSAKGVVAETDPSLGDTAKTIDVAGCPGNTPATLRNTRFAPGGGVGGSCTAAPNNVLFNAGAVVIDVNEAGLVGGGTSDVLNQLAQVFNLTNTSVVKVTVDGTDLSTFTGAGNAFLSTSAACATADLVGTVAADNKSIAFSGPVTNAVFSGLTNSPATATQAYVCLRANGNKVIHAQNLSAKVDIDYASLFRVNPSTIDAGELLPLRQNGTTLTFQNVNPDNTPTAQSFLRLSNHNGDVCPVTIESKNDAGERGGDVRLTLQPHASMQINSIDLENGNAGRGITGGFGPNTGKWYVRVQAECTNFTASALNRNRDTGTVTDLTSEKGNGTQWSAPNP